MYRKNSRRILARKPSGEYQSKELLFTNTENKRQPTNAEEGNMANRNFNNNITQGFTQSQTSGAGTCSHPDIISLLQKVSSQLQQLQQQTSGQNGNTAESSYSDQGEIIQNGGQSPKKETATYNVDQNQNVSPNGNQTETMVTQELQNLFSQLLQGNNNLQSSPEQAPEFDNKTQNKANSMAVQTAGQVLAKAQYELANELETSLNKLKQVISESEKIANQISNLLGESNNKKA